METTDQDAPMQVQGLKFALIPEWVLYHTELTAVSVRVYGVLARLSGCDEIRPSRSFIAAKVDMSVESVKRSLLNLQEVGAIVVTPRFDDERGQMANLYRLVGDEPQKPRSVGGVTGDPGGGGVTRVPGGGSPVTHEVKKEEVKKENQVAAAPLLRVVSHDFGADPDAPVKETKSAPTVQVVDHFLDEWTSVITHRTEYGMLQRVPNRTASYTWLNQQFFKPRHGEPIPLHRVIAMVDEFMHRVRTDQITPSPGFSAWQCFQKNLGRLGSDAVAADLPGTVYI